MQLGPTLDGRIKVVINHDGDFYLLSQLIQDAYGDHSSSLVDQVGNKIDDEDWEEFVKPELISQFQSDILAVSNIVQKAQEDDIKEIFISSEERQAWYSTLNQARLNLENRYKLSEVKEDLSVEEYPEDLVEPIIKGDFYTHLQGLILEYLEW